MLVTCPNLDFTLPGLPPSVLPIQAKSFMYRSAKRQATFYQFPVTLAYAITDYKCQSLTFDQVVVDLKRPSTGFAPAASAYVQLSRCRTIDRLSIIRPFDPAELTTKLSKELSDELKWQEEMDLKTRERYDSLISARLEPLSNWSLEVINKSISTFSLGGVSFIILGLAY